MIKTSLALLTLSVAAAPLAFAESKAYDAGDFSVIDARGAINVVYNPAATRSVSVEQAGGDFSDIDISVEGDTLVISRVSLSGKSGWKRNVSIKNKNGEMVVKVNGKVKPNYIVTVAGPTLTAVSVSSSSDLVANNIEGETFSAEVSSSGDIELSGTVQSLSLSASSSGDIEATELTATHLEIDTSSSADINAMAYGGNLTIVSSSSSDVNVTAGSLEAVDIDSSSSSDVTVTGTCVTLIAEASSSADIDASDLKCETGRLTAGSGSDIEANLSAKLYARASSGADIEVSGSANDLDIKESSGGSISF